MTHKNIYTLPPSAKYVIDHFIQKKIQVSRWEKDEKLQMKLEGIKAAVDCGLLRVINIPAADHVRVSATNKLLNYYNL